MTKIIRDLIEKCQNYKIKYNTSFVKNKRKLEFKNTFNVNTIKTIVGSFSDTITEKNRCFCAFSKYVH